MVDINLQVQEIAENALAEENIEVSEGMPLHDLFIQNMEIIFDRFARELENIKQQTSLENPEELDAGEVDARVSNFFVDRDEGTRSFGEIRLLFESPREIEIPEEEPFFSSEGTRFLASERVQVDRDEMSGNQQGEFFYADVEVKSSEPGQGNGEEILFMNNEPTGLVGIETINIPGGGRDGETNKELVERTENQLGLRNLVREQTIDAVIENDFPFISDIQSIGMDDPEMERDLVPWMLEAPSGVQEYHSGMHADIYIQAQEAKEDFVIIDPINDPEIEITAYEENTDDAGNTIYNEVPLDSSGIHHFEYNIDSLLKDVPIGLLEVCIITGVDDNEVEQNTENAIIRQCEDTFQIRPDPNTNETQVEAKMDMEFSGESNLPERIGNEYAFSTKVDNKLWLRENQRFGFSNANLILCVHYMYVPEIAVLQDYIDDSDNRVLVADILAKHFVPVFLDINVDYVGDVEPDQLVNILENKLFFDEIQEVSDLVQVLSENGADFIDMDTMKIDKFIYSKTGEIISATNDVAGSLYGDENVSPKTTRRIQTLIPRELNMNKMSEKEAVNN